MLSDQEARMVLVVTVGRTDAPIVKAIDEHGPDGVIFLASHDSLPVVAQILRIVQLHRQDVVVVEDPEDLASCLSAGEHALRLATKWHARSVTVDITGGTKPMCAGAALAFAGHEVMFSYVGGNERDEYGRVVSGTEQVRVIGDPVPSLEESRWELFCEAWNRNHFREAEGHASWLTGQVLPNRWNELYGAFAEIAAGMRAWDELRYEVANEHLKESISVALSLSAELNQGAKWALLQQLEELTYVLPRLASGDDTDLLVSDLLANAVRRFHAGSYMDAATRIQLASSMLSPAGSQFAPDREWLQAEFVNQILEDASRLVPPLPAWPRW